MSEIGDQIIASLEEALADVKGEPTGLLHHVVMVPEAVDLPIQILLVPE